MPRPLPRVVPRVVASWVVPSRISVGRVAVSRTDVRSAVAQERRALVEDLELLTPEQWSRPSLCPGWSVHDVVAHLVDGAHLTRLAFVGRTLRAGGDLEHGARAGVRAWRDRDPQVTLAALADAIGSTTGPPVPLAAQLVEVYVHSEDVRRPLALPRPYPTAPVLAALDHQTRTSVVLGGGKELAQDLTLSPSDTLVSIGSGPRVSGRAIDLLLALSGRPVAPSALRGPGAEELLARMRL